MNLSKWVLWHFNLPWHHFPLLSLAVVKMTAGIPSVYLVPQEVKQTFFSNSYVFVLTCLVAPWKTASKGLPYFTSENSQGWGSFPGRICQKHLKANVLDAAS